MHLSKSCFALTFASLVFVAGCGQSRETSQVSTDTTAIAPVVPAPDSTAIGAPVWVADLRRTETALGETIEQGRLAEVHDHAEKLQSLLKQVTGQDGDLTPEQQQQANEHVNAAGRLAAELHDAGDAGDLTKAKAKFLEFKTHLRAIEGVFGVSAP